MGLSTTLQRTGPPGIVFSHIMGILEIIFSYLHCLGLGKNIKNRGKNEEKKKNEENNEKNEEKSLIY